MTQSLNGEQIRELIVEALEDDVGLWCIIWNLKRQMGIENPAELRGATMNSVRLLLDTGEVVAGYYNAEGNGVDIWNCSTEEVLYKIDTEWTRLGHTPGIGEVVVFLRRE